LVIPIVLMSSCQWLDEPEAVPARRVVLMYAAAYNNLSPDIEQDVKELCEGSVPDSCNPDILLVYDHHTSSYGDYSTPVSPVLYRAYKDKEGTVYRDTVKVYPDTDVSSSAEAVNKALTDAQRLFPASSYGLVFSSHGTGWLPENYTEEDNGGSDIEFLSARAARRASIHLTKSLGHENKHEIDIRQLAEAIPMKLDFFLIDACLMGCVEVAYELKDKCDLIVFSPTEILTNGFIYTDLASRLLDISVPDIKQVCEDYFNFYNDRTDYYKAATITMVDCSKLDALAAVCSEIISAHRSGIAAVNRSSVQAYHRDDYGMYPLRKFYDLKDLLEKGGATEQELARLDSALGECVVLSRATPWFLSRKLDRVCGLSMYFPYPDKEELNDYYKTLSWNKATGLIQ